MRVFRSTLAALGTVAIAAFAFAPPAAADGESAPTDNPASSIENDGVPPETGSTPGEPSTPSKPGSSITLPDPALQACVTAGLGLPADAAIPAERVSEVTDLTCTTPTLASLAGIDALTALKNVTVSGSQVTNLAPLGTLHDLQTVTATGIATALPEVQVGVLQPSMIIGIDGRLTTLQSTVTDLTVSPEGWTFQNGHEAPSGEGTLTYAYQETATGVAVSVEGKITQSAAATPAAVGDLPVVTTQPQDVHVVEGTEVSFTAQATSDTPVTVQWITSLDDGVTWYEADGFTTETIAFVPVVEDNNALLAAVFTNEAGRSISTPARLTVDPLTGPPTITEHPQHVTVAPGQSARFESKATQGNMDVTVEWQHSTDGGATWSALPVDMIDETPDEASPAVRLIMQPSTWIQTPPVSASDNGTQFRVIFTNPDGSATSDAATLTVTKAGQGGGPADGATDNTAKASGTAKGDKLATTGANSLGMILGIGGGLVAAGGGIVLALRHKRRTTA